MDKKKKAALLKKRVADEHIKALEKFQCSFSENVANEVLDALECLERYKEEYFAAITQLMELDDSNEAIEVCIQERIAMDDRCRHVCAFLRDQQPKESNLLGESTLLPSSSTFAFSKPNASNLRLPKIDLPIFDGDYSKWLSFRDRFIAMIDASTELPSISKLQYLLSSLRGEAAIPHEHTTLTADNYSITWASLLNRYDNSRMLIREYYRTLHHFPAVQTECVDELAHLVDEFGRHVNGLVKLHEPIEHWDTPLSNMLLMKLDPSTILAWEKHSVNHDKDKYKEVIEYLYERIRILKSSQRFSGEAPPAVIKVAGNQRHSATHRRSITNNAPMEHTPTSFSSFHQPKCPLACADNHSLRNCPVFLSYDTQQRRNLVKSKGLCWNCLSGSYLPKVCRSDYSCRSCHERHHTLLHQTAQPKVTLAVHAEDEAVFLETAVVLIADDYENHHEARALLDSGSMSNFMSERLARKLITTRTKVNVSVSGIGKTVQHVRGSITAIVRSKAHHFST
ncbi:uncharacterized protein LOC118508017 [Anopheles stephensi]|uniref:uncharacterized protein LOC118508017 n=1 Tax=Anopheles stephensi TaxID=30069 RepID=UPI00165877AD|nr:uncharacterized protein LOC118508017 [Anopheles stephensi]